MSVPVNFLYIKILETRFNTLEIVGNIQHLLDGGSGLDKAKYKLWNIMFGHLSLEVRAKDIQTVAMGFKIILLCLTDFVGYNGH